MLNKTRTITLGVMLVLVVTMMAPGKRFEADRQIGSAGREIAAVGGDFTLTGFGVDGGGGPSSGGDFAMYVNIGQPDAGEAAGGDFELHGGYSQPPAAPSCLADLNSDGIVDAADLALLLGGWGACAGCAPDINGDDVVDAADLALLLGAWGPC